MKKRALSLLLVLALCAGLVPTAALAAEDAPNDDFVIENGVLIKYTGPGGNVVIPDGVTEIGKDVFRLRADITSVVIPNGVTHIRDRAFYDCVNLSSVNFPYGLVEIGEYAFTDTGLTEVTLSSTVKTIKRSFGYCEQLAVVTIPASVTYIESGAFYPSDENGTVAMNCEAGSAAERFAEHKNISYTTGRFDGDTFVPDEPEPSPTPEPTSSPEPSPSQEPTESESPSPSPSTMPTPAPTVSPSPSPTPSPAPSPSVEPSESPTPSPAPTPTPSPSPAPQSEFVIDENGVLTSYQGTATDVVIPDGVTAVAFGAFSSNTLTSVTFPDSVTEIQKSAFSSQKNLKRVTFGKGLTTIREDAFASCAALTEVSFPDSLKTIEDMAFFECFELARVELGNGVTTIGNGAFWDCRSLTEIIIPQQVTHIGPQAFHRSNGVIISIKGTLGGAAEYYIKHTWVNRNTEIFIPGTFVNGEFVSDGKAYDLETYFKKEQAKTAQQQAIARCKGSAYYQDCLQANQAVIDSITECDYIYTWVPDDIQALSDQLCEGLTSDYDRVFALHDWVTENIYYSHPAFNGQAPRHDSIQEAYDTRNCVCVGYANLMQSLCWAQGIPAVHVHGTAGGAHAWNAIQINGEWLWMDATWDTYNSYNGPSSWYKGDTRLNYFLCSTEFMSTDHKAKSLEMYAGENITVATYYALYYPAKNPNSKAAVFSDALDDATVKEINAIRADAGLFPVTATTWGPYFCLNYEPQPEAEDAKPDQTLPDPSVVTPMTSEEIHKKQDEELEKEYQEDMKKYSLDDATLSPWAKDEVTKAIDSKLVPQNLLSRFNTNITRAEFCQLIMQMVETTVGTTGKDYIAKKGLTYGDHPFTDVSRYSSYADSVTCAYILGIVKGTSETTFNPDGQITRQEAATMLARTAKVLGVKAGQSAVFADADTFADWSRDSIAFISGITDPLNGKTVMEGTGAGVFSPLMTYSREQAIVTALRLFNAAGGQTA